MKSITLCFALIFLVMSLTRPALSDEKDAQAGFLRAVKECKEELNVTENVLADLFRLWKMEYDNLDRNAGCLIICLSKKLDLIDMHTGKLRRGSAKEFAMEHGADEEIATKLVNILHECEKQHEGVPDDCLRSLEVTKCFRTNIDHLNWTPKTEIVISEVLTEI